MTEDEDDSVLAREPLALDRHVEEVVAHARLYSERAHLPQPLRETLRWAAEQHDTGKLDRRFQEFLILAGRSGGPSGAPLAKSGRRTSRVETRAYKRESGLPEHWRHEVASVQAAMAAQAPPEVDRELALWLIGTHHGQGRPFFRHDDSERLQMPAEIPLDAGPSPARLDFDCAGMDWAELFETLKRRYGVWGLAYLEAVLRLADHRASEAADARGGEAAPIREAAE